MGKDWMSLQRTCQQGDYREPPCSTDCSNQNLELYLSGSLGGGLFGCIVLDRVSFTAMKHFGQNQLGGRGFSLALGSTSQCITEESQSRDSGIDPGARTIYLRQVMEECCLPACNQHQLVSGTTSTWGGTTHNELDSPTSINQENEPPQASLVGTLPRLRFPLLK